MKQFISKKTATQLVLLLTTVLIGVTGYLIYTYDILQSENSILETRVAELETSLGQTKSSLKVSENEKIGLSKDLDLEQEKVGSLAEQVDEVIGLADDLEKLSKIDPELLQKYSKVFFLNEHYVPPRLRNITTSDLYYEATPLQVHSDIWKHLDNLIDDAADDGVTLWILSAYRSFGTQSSLKSSYLITYGSGANAFSADQGYSEHQLGTTVDFTTSGIKGSYDEFENTEAYQWLLNNAHLYGFTLSYPEGNSFYVFESWHWRFVGIELARDLHNDGKGFYDIPQREIDEYQLNFFD